ncbi:MAG: polysaccharide biosynthesis C-terminal domain-containing protein [Calditrichia bacterium]
MLSYFNGYSFSVDVKVSRPILYIGLVLLWSISLYRMNLDIARSKLSPKRYGILASLKAVIALSLGTLLVFFGAGAKGVLVGLILGFIFPSFWMIIKEWYIVRRRYFDKNILLQLVKYGIPLITSFALNAVIHSSDRIMLGWIIGKSDAGLYSSGYNIAQQILIFSMSTINLAAYPIVVRSLEKKRLAETDKNLSMYFTILIGIALPITVGLSLLSKDISNIFLGQAYREAANRLIPWISIGIFFMGIRAFYTDMAFQLGKRTIGQASVLFIAAFVNIVLNILWIPNLGMIGAAYSTVLSCAIALFLSWFVGKKIFYLPFPFRDIFKIIFATFFMTFSLYLTSSMEGILGFVAKISIGILTYAICSILLNVGGVKKYLHTNIPLLNKSKN